MDKRSVTDGLRRAAEGAEFITKGQFMENFIKIKKYDHVKKYFVGLESVDGKYYQISDVAKNVMRHMRPPK